MMNNPPANAGDMGLIPGSGRSPGGGNGNPLQYCCLENPTDRGASAGYSPWGRTESDTTSQLSTRKGEWLQVSVGFRRVAEADGHTQLRLRKSPAQFYLYPYFCDLDQTP